MEDEQIQSRAGTISYQPPELFKSAGSITGKPVDVWAAGVTLYQMVYGYHPFYNTS